MAKVSEYITIIHGLNTTRGAIIKYDNKAKRLFDVTFFIDKLVNKPERLTSTQFINKRIKLLLPR